MGKSKSNCLTKLPKDQRCQFFIGPSGSWFFPSNTDIWTQPKGIRFDGEYKVNVSQEELMEFDHQVSRNEENASLSYFIYGSVGCFCYGEIHHHAQKVSQSEPTKLAGIGSEFYNQVSATLNQLIDVKEDHSRVICTRFLKTSPRPIAMILTENGSLLIHDCIKNENLIQYKKSELIAKFIEPGQDEDNAETDAGEPSNKRLRYDIMHQINSCSWPNNKNAFIGISLPKRKINHLMWLQLKDLTEKFDKDDQTITKNNFIGSHIKLNLDSSQNYSPICCLESVLLPDSNSCLVAVAMDDGLITVVNVNFDQGQAKRVIKLARHREQICSMSFLVGPEIKFQQGLLASSSRDGLVTVWDIENEFYFAYYTVPSEIGRGKSGHKIDWFACKFLQTKRNDCINLAISNSSSGLTVFKLPKEKPKSIIKLKEIRDNKPTHKRQQNSESSLRHHAIIFNIASDPSTGTLMTTSIDGNLIFWKCNSLEVGSRDKNTKDELGPSVEVKPQYMLPSMTDSSRVHMLRHSPIRENFLGLALDKGGVRFYKITENSKDNRFDMSSSCSEIARRIAKASLSPTSIAWHPHHEYRLSIGTLQGKVLRIDLTPQKPSFVESDKKQVNRSKTSGHDGSKTRTDDNIFDVEYQPLERDDDDVENGSKDSQNGSQKTDGVYSLCWGPNPCCPQDISRLAIYAIGSISHRLSIYENYSSKTSGDDKNEKMTDYLDEFLDQSLPEAIGEASDVAWKSSMELMALGTTTGKIIIASYLDESHAGRSKNNLFKKIAIIQGPLGPAQIQCLAWHPTTDIDDQFYYYIAATSSNDPIVYVFSINENMLIADVKSRLIIDESANGRSAQSHLSGGGCSNVVSSFVHKLDGHKKGISDLAWNPHEPNELATSSFDRSCYVWSLDSSQGSNARILSKFTARQRLFTLEWSLVDTDLIFTSGQDRAIWAWRPSENRANQGDRGTAE